MEVRSFLQPPQLAISEGATTPNPGGTAACGVIAWSTTLSANVRWSGTAWNAVGAAGSAIAPIYFPESLISALNTPGTLSSGQIVLVGNDSLALPGYVGFEENVAQRFTPIIPETWRKGLNLAPGNTTSMQALGMPAMSATGTATANAISNASYYSRAPKAEALVSTASATAVAGWRVATNPWTYTTNANEYMYLMLSGGVATGTSVSTRRFFLGVTGSTAAPTDVNPSSILSCVGIGWDSGDAQLSLIYRGATTGAVKTTLGSGLKAIADRSFYYELELHFAANRLMYSVRAFSTADGKIFSWHDAITNFDSVCDADFSTAICPRVWSSVGGTSGVTGVALSKCVHAVSLW